MWWSQHTPKCISIHAPLTGSDLLFRKMSAKEAAFQSTLPLRGATLNLQDQYDACKISIHAPLTGSDLRNWRQMVGGRISIHAPLTGSDLVSFALILSILHFNPRSPYGERLLWLQPCAELSGFQSTLPLRGATRPRCANTGDGRNFNPRSPYGERLVVWLLVCGVSSYFNPRSPYGERPLEKFHDLPPVNFNPRSPYGERRASTETKTKTQNFNPRSPYGERPPKSNFLTF